MTTQQGFSVRIFIPTGEPEGLRVIEKSNWTGQGLFFPRSLYSEVRDREELGRTGVYILWGADESKQLTRAYVGEGDTLLPRLNDHVRSKEFWTHGVVFTSKDQNLNKAHVQHLEARLVALAAGAKRCVLDNGNLPQPPSLSDADRADAELFLADMLLCLPVVGVSFFEKPRAEQSPDQRLFLNSKGIHAEGYEAPGGFVVRAEAKAVSLDGEADSISQKVKEQRATLLDQGIFVLEGNELKLTQDYLFTSPSNASCVLLGNSSNGRTEWKDSGGRTLKSIQDAAVEEA